MSALDQARGGDALVVWKLDRIGRSERHVGSLIGDFQKRVVGLEAPTGNFDSTTATGRFVFGIFANLADFVRDLIHRHTMVDRAAHTRGRAGGRSA